MTFLLILVTLILLVLAVFYILQLKQLKYYETVSKNLSTMAVIQNMFEIIGDNISAKEKIEELNKKIIENFNAKYSTISVYDGTSYEVKATNIDKMYIDSIGSIAEEVDFKNNTIRNVSKYITTSHDKTLMYKTAVERKIRSCMFSPIYFNGTYIGFWIMEDEEENAFDEISKDELAKLKNNMGVFIENTLNQSIIETAENTDKQTGFYNSLYLYSNTVKILNSKPTSALILLCLNNLEEINEKYTRNVGNILIIKIANLLKELFSNDTIFIRYSGKRFLLVCPNTDVDSIQPLVEKLVTNISNITEYVNEQKVNLTSQFVLHTFRKQNNVEKELQKMVKYSEEIKESNVIKII